MKVLPHRTPAQNQPLAGTSSSTASQQTAPPRRDFTPSADAIARRAYAIFISEGAPHGRDIDHWLAAESQLIDEHYHHAEPGPSSSTAPN